MLFDDTYLTIGKPAESVFRDRGSKFMAYAYPINNDQDVKDILHNLKLEHPKANHHCFAVRWSADRSVFRINDDGEPSGTAGRPILNVLLSRNVTNIVVIVVRYFGGTLLGVPGLINAYRTATEQALDLAKVIEKTINDIYTISFDYLQMNDVMRIVKEDNLGLLEQHFDNNCTIQVAIRKMMINQSLSKFQKLPSVKVKYEYTT